jgi:hypothetical protein
MTTTSARRRHQARARRRPRTAADSFASVYVDESARIDAVRAAVDQLPTPIGVNRVAIDDRSVTGTFGCRIAVDLTGTFDETTEGRTIARDYARQLSDLLGVPAFAFYDLVRTDPAKFIC